MDTRNQTHVARVSHAWFIFNLNIESHYLQIIYYNIYTSFNAHSTQLLLPTILYLLTWRTNVFARSGEYPSTLAPGLPTTAPPFASSPALSHPIDQVTIFT
jgi:hypothetical protein